MNANNIISVQEAFSPTLYNQIKTILNVSEFPWFCIESSAYKNENSSVYQTPSFVNQIYHNATETHWVSPRIETGFVTMLDKCGLRIKNLIRIRIGMMIGNPQSSRFIVNAPHVDYEFPHYSALIYLTTCDAPTIFYDKFFDSSDREQLLTGFKDSDIKIHKEIQSIENTAVIFNGLRYHSSSIPTNTKKRIVINIGFTLEE